MSEAIILLYYRYGIYRLKFLTTTHAALHSSYHFGLIPKLHTPVLCIIGASLSEPHLDELAGELFWYIIESVDSISRDERDVPSTQYITNA